MPHKVPRFSSSFHLDSLASRLSLWRTLLLIALGLIGNGLTSTGFRASAQDTDITSWSSSPTYTDLEEARTVRASGTPIYKLDLSKSRLKSFPAEIAHWDELREVTLDRNKISEINEDLSQWQHLVRFSAASNQLNAFPDDLTQWSALEFLNLADNYIDSIPLDIDAMQHLQEVILWSNVIEHYPASLGDMKELLRLDLEYNDMTAEEQELLKSWLPDRVQLVLSKPCRCQFDD